MLSMTSSVETTESKPSKTIDFVVFGSTVYHQRMAKLLQRLNERNVRINPKKSVFAVPKLKFLGYCVDGKGIQPDTDRIKAA